MEKTFTLTLEEFLEAIGEDISKKRTKAPSLIVLGLGTMAFWVLALWIGVDKYKVPQLHALTAISAAVAVVGCLLWKWEGQRSSEKQRALKQAKYAQWLTPRTFRLDRSGWTVASGDTQDQRTVAALKAITDRKNVVVLLTDTLHVIPKRILAPEELYEIRTLLSLSDKEAKSVTGVELTTWDFVGSAIAYYRWRYPGYFLMFLLTPPAAVAFLVVNAHISPFDYDRLALPYEIPLACGAAILWYLCLPIYEFAYTVAKRRPAFLEQLDDRELALRVKEAKTRLCWKEQFDAREFSAYFLFETAGLYFPIPKRLLTAEQVLFLKSKVASALTESA